MYTSLQATYFPLGQIYDYDNVHVDKLYKCLVVKPTWVVKVIWPLDDVAIDVLVEAVHTDDRYFPLSAVQLALTQRLYNSVTHWRLWGGEITKAENAYMVSVWFHDIFPSRFSYKIYNSANYIIYISYLYMYRKGTSIWQAPVFRHIRALQKKTWKVIIWMNEL